MAVCVFDVEASDHLMNEQLMYQVISFTDTRVLLKGGLHKNTLFYLNWQEGVHCTQYTFFIHLPKYIRRFMINSVTFDSQIVRVTADTVL